MEILINHIEKVTNIKIPLSDSLFEIIKLSSFSKKEYLLKEGQSCRYMFFIKKGIVRMFYYDDLGGEQTIQLAIDKWWITDFNAFAIGTASNFYLQALEPTEVYAISKEDYESLLHRNFVLEKYFRKIYERAYAASLQRMQYLRFSKEIFFDIFEDKYPEIIQRVPQKYLASFLGFTPEYLSELRRKKRDNERK